jgi:regulator of PEP synthase PpsR (kinase-PPPase family)
VARQFHLHLVSDATGETVSAVARACIVQFKDVEPISHLWWLVRSTRQVERVVASVRANPGLVLATVIDTKVRRALEEACRELNIPFIPVLDPVLAALAGHLEAEIGTEPGRQHALDAEYFRRIDAMHYTLAHDDGQQLYGLEQADIVLVGVSRTSKTPTCMYLANRGLKAANYPLVPGVELPEEINRLKKPLLVGLVRDPKSLAEMRRSRLRLLNEEKDFDYADDARVQEEVTVSRRLFARREWPVIDVTRRSIEEVAAAIVQLYDERKAAQGEAS